MVGQNTAAEDHAIAAHEAVGADVDGLAVLAVVLQINGMAEQLGVVAGDGAEGPDGDAVGAVDVVVFGDGGMFTKQELCAALGLMGEVRGVCACGKTGDPVGTADRGMGPHLESIEIHRHGACGNASAGSHLQPAGVDPGKADAGGGGQLIAEAALQQGTFQRPWQGHDDRLPQDGEHLGGSHVGNANWI